MALARDQRVWPAHATPGVSPGSKLSADGRLMEFTAACGPVIYRGDLFPEAFRGRAFVCEPAANLIRCCALLEENGSLRAENAFPQREFMEATDERFRPVNLYNGPDGALWVVDMYRGVIEHKTFITRALKKYIQREGLARPTGLGRIWRIVPETTRPGPLPKMSGRGTIDLVAQLSARNGWQRDTAQRLLVESGDVGASEGLRRLLTGATFAPARLHALWTLHGLGALDSATVAMALSDGEPKVRAAAIRLSEPFLEKDAPLKRRLLDMVSDRAPEVQLQLTLTLGEMEGPEGRKGIITLLASGPENPYVPAAAIAGLAGEELETLKELLSLAPKALAGEVGASLLQRLTAAIITDRDPRRCSELLDFIGQQAEPWPRWALVEAITDLPNVALGGYRPIALAHEPASWPKLAPELDAEIRTRLADRFLWPGKPSPLEPRIEPLTEDQQRLFAHGKELFGQICAACHHAKGEGEEGLAPPLVNSEWTLGSEEVLTRIVLHGLAGEIEVAGRTYNLEMPPLQALSDEQIASVLTYIRREWNHHASPIESAKVAEIRAVSGRRERPWSGSALKRVAR